MLSYKQLKEPRQWRSAIGLNEHQFNELCKAFSVIYERIHGISLPDKCKNLNQQILFTTYEDAVFFLLFALKNDLVFDNLGLIFGTDGSNAQRAFDRLFIILEKTLEDCELLPIRNFKDLEDFTSKLDENSELIIDVTEMEVERPSNFEKQKDSYSGKKKMNSLKSLIISNTERYILFLGNLVFGSLHDFKILQTDFSPDIPWFRNQRIRVDLGFIGIDKLYEILKLAIPHKRKKAVKGIKSELTDEQKKENKQKSKERIVVEHAIGGMKRYRTIINRIRFKSLSFINRVVGVCAGLWNFNLSI